MVQENCYFIITACLCVVFQCVSSSPLNSIDPQPKGDSSPCLHDCTDKQGYCRNGGTCVKLKDICTVASYVCVCPEGYTGARCEDVIKHCKYDDFQRDYNCNCENGGTCRKVGNECVESSYTCDCISGFQGQYCQYNSSSLESVPVVNATSSQVTEDFAFKPTVTVNKTSSFSMNVSEISKTSTSRQTANQSLGNVTTAAFIEVIQLGSSTTTSKPTTKKLLRKTIWRLLNFLAQRRSETKLKNAGNDDSNICQKCDHGRCSQGGKTCLCDTGYVGPRCDIKCLKQCLNGGECSVINGKEKCSCPEGYKGELCDSLPVDGSPDQKPAENSTKANVTTTEQEGQQLDKRFCSNNFKCVHGECDISDPKSPKCVCHKGFNGVFCHINCSKECQNGGSCVRINDTERCSCPRSHSGEFCHISCSKACQNGGSCVRINNTERCSCPLSYSGEFCEYAHIIPTEFQTVSPPDHQNVDLKVCSEDFKCIHGICDKTSATGKRCLCYGGFHGTFCETPCSKPCANGGACRLFNGLETCECTDQFTGDFCEEPVVKNTDNFVKNERHCSANFKCIHGQCNMSKHGSPRCICYDGFTGLLCHITCSKPCLNQGQCVRINDTESCNCPFGFSGEFCSESKIVSVKPFAALDKNRTITATPQDKIEFANKRSVNILKECTKLCENGGRCVFRGSEHVCKCPSHYTGEFCQYDFSRIASVITGLRRVASAPKREPYSSNPKKCSANFVCQHGKCSSKNRKYPRCKCDPGWVGLLCQKRCDLPCGNRGRCIVLSEKQYCNCKPGYDGRLCEIALSASGANATTSTESSATSPTTMNTVTSSVPPVENGEV